MREWVRRALLENVWLKGLAFVLAITLFILVRVEKDAVIGAYVQVSYTLPEDRVLTTARVDQVRVMLRGTWSRVKRFDAADVDPIRVNLTHASDGEFTFQEDMLLLPPGLKILSINPPSLRLTFQKLVTRLVPIHAVVEGTPATGHKVERIVTRPTHLLIRGAKSIVEALASVDTRAVTLSERAGSFSERVHVAPTEEHVEVVDPVPIDVEITMSDEQSELRLDAVRVVPRAPAGVRLGAELSGWIQPPTISIVLRGTKAALDQVDKRRVEAVIELGAADLTRARARRIAVHLEGVPEGVAVEVTPREIAWGDRGRDPVDTPPPQVAPGPLH
jgi:YbbR domain-containing protein